MTEQEAIKALEFDMEMILFDPYEGKKRTPEEVKNINEANYLCYLADEMAIKALEYMAKIKEMGDCYIIPKNGTWEVDGIDIPKAIEKQKPKEPVKTGLFKKCPTCGNDEIFGSNYCHHCGQKLDWE